MENTERTEKDSSQQNLSGEIAMGISYAEEREKEIEKKDISYIFRKNIRKRTKKNRARQMKSKMEIPAIIMIFRSERIILEWNANEKGSFRTRADSITDKRARLFIT